MTSGEDTCGPGLSSPGYIAPPALARRRSRQRPYPSSLNDLRRMRRERPRRFLVVARSLLLDRRLLARGAPLGVGSLRVAIRYCPLHQPRGPASPCWSWRTPSRGIVLRPERLASPACSYVANCGVDGSGARRWRRPVRLSRVASVARETRGRERSRPHRAVGSLGGPLPASR